MLNIFNNSEEEKKFISNYNNPFQSDKVQSIKFLITKGYLSFNKNEITYISYIEFQNGNSSGEQKIEASDFITLVKETELFIKNL